MPFPAAKCIGAVNLDTVGRLGKGKLLVLGTGSAREWIHIFNGAGYVTGVPIEGAAADPGGSDQKSFLDAGIPAVQLFSGPHLDYHAPTDTADKVDAEGLVKVAMVAREAIDYLAGRAEPLTTTLAGRRGDGSLGAGGRRGGSGRSAGGSGRAAGGPGGPPAGRSVPPAGPGGPPGGAGRRVSVGTVPDFGLPGAGIEALGRCPRLPGREGRAQGRGHHHAGRCLHPSPT